MYQVCFQIKSNIMSKHGGKRIGSGRKKIEVTPEVLAERKKRQREYERKHYQKNKELILKKRREREEAAKCKDGFFSVYYLPKENYVGMTDNVSLRMSQHSYKGKDVEGYEVLATFDNPFDAHIFETQKHKEGYKGFHIKYKYYETKSNS